MKTTAELCEEFLARVRARMAAGAAEYGDKSFQAPAPKTIDEIQQELADVCGWSAVLYVRLERLKEAAKAVDPWQG